MPFYRSNYEIGHLNECANNRLNFLKDAYNAVYDQDTLAAVAMCWPWPTLKKDFSVFINEGPTPLRSLPPRLLCFLGRGTKRADGGTFKISFSNPKATLSQADYCLKSASTSDQIMEIINHAFLRSKTS